MMPHLGHSQHVLSLSGSGRRKKEFFFYYKNAGFCASLMSWQPIPASSLKAAAAQCEALALKVLGGCPKRQC